MQERHFNSLRLGSVNSGAGIDLGNLPLYATFTIGAEAANVINVAIQLQDSEGADIAQRAVVYGFLSTDATGDALKASDAALTTAIGTDGFLLEVGTDSLFLLGSEADGDIDINFTKTDAGTFYLHLLMPPGNIVSSGAITFA